MTESILISLPASRDGGYRRAQNFGGGYYVTEVEFAGGCFCVRFECSGNRKKRLRAGSISFTPALVARMMEALTEDRARPRATPRRRATVRKGSLVR